jgi:Fe-S-cluster containining protein
MINEENSSFQMIHKCENCGNCCIETEMILSEQDIDLIIKLGSKKLSKDKFVIVNKDGFFQLKNIEGHCVFFDKTSKKCNIYEYRPKGCRFYPLIYDFLEQKCVLDEECPRTYLFYQTKKQISKKCKELERFLKRHLRIKLY